MTTRKYVEHELAQYVASLSNLVLHPQIEYAVLSEGKRLRPFLVILSAESVGGERAKVTGLALAFELMHTATLVHDDIIDQDETRRSKPALHKKWSINDAILTGDALIALSVHLASSYGKQVLQTVAQSALELCNGEKMDVTFSPETTTEESYFTRITQKSASLFRASMQCGALAGGGTASEVQALANFGENFGVAYQLKDDLSDLTNKGNSPLKDLRAGRITLPLIHCYNNANLRNKECVDSLLQILLNGRRGDKSKAATSLFAMLQKAGSFSYCGQKINDHLHQAVKSISILKDTEYKTHLIEMTKALKE
jgi:geranylgeranyl diphosphate synthase type I